MITVHAFSQHCAVEAVNRLTFDMYKNLSQSNEGNMMFSPYSVSSALAMTYAGAKEQTAKEMEKVLYYPERNEENKIHNDFSTLNETFADYEKYFQLSVANSLWAQEDFDFRDEYFKLIKKYYQAALDYLDFKDNPEKARKTINKWVEKATRGKIEDLIPPKGVNELTRLVLTNAIYFKAEWKDQFKEKLTKEDVFYTDNNKKIKTPFMNQKSRMKYIEDESFKAIELSYKGRMVSMVIVLPNKKGNMKAFEKQLNILNYNSKLKEMQYETVQLSMPKFSFSSNYNLTGNLKQLGIKQAFSKNANFSLMTGKPNVRIDRVFHKTFIEVNESGTEAAAATAVVMMEKTAAPPSDKKIFKADHPFIFFIKDNKTGSILFAGRVMEPGE